MAHIFCITTGLTGILNSSIAVVSQLESAGHTVTYAAPTKVRQRVIDEGLNYCEVPSIEVSQQDIDKSLGTPTGRVERYTHKLLNQRKYYQEYNRQWGVEQIRDIYESGKPDCVIADVEMHPHILVAMSMDIPVFLLSPWFSFLPSKTIPPLSSELTPPFSLMEVEKYWKEEYLQNKRFLRRRRIRGAFCDRWTAILRLARQCGLGGHQIAKYYWPMPFIYVDMPILSMTAREMEFPHPPDQITYIGPQVTGVRKEGRSAQFDDFIKSLRSSRNDRPIIYCTLGSFVDGDVVFLNKLLQVFEANEEWMGILSMGNKTDISNLGSVPDNLRVLEWVPQPRVISLAHVCLNHGGINTIHECIDGETPMVVYSGKRFDQNGCAARIAHHGLGLCGDKDVDGPAEIAEKIRMVLDNSAFQKSVCNMKRAVQHYYDEPSWLKLFEEGTSK